MRTLRHVLESKSTTRVVEYTIIVGSLVIVVIAAIKSLGFG
jgi:Flp pilus assembly pilin Flp